VSRLTATSDGSPDIGIVKTRNAEVTMNSFDMWLRKQVLRLEHEIRTNPVFDGDSVPTRDELIELRRLTVIHRFLNGNLQQIESRDSSGATSPDRARTREIALRRAISSHMPR
jgi:hypothetical protein